MEDLNEAFYAYPALKKFPMNTGRITESSYNAYRMQKNAFSEAARASIEANFRKAAAYYGISLQDGPEEGEKREMLMFKGASESVSMTEIRSKEELGQAIDFILEKRASTPRESLAEPAKYILWSASNTDVDMTTPKFRKIAHIAGIGVGDRDKIEREIEKRAAMQNTYSENDRAALWKYAKEVKSLPDSEFYRESTLNTICNVLDNVDFMCGMQHKHASELGYPEDTVFSDTVDDLLKEASDLYYIPSIDATLSKKATLERENAINSFFSAHFAGFEPLKGENLIKKVASLDSDSVTALLSTVE